MIPVMSYCNQSPFEEVRALLGFPYTPRELKEVSNPLFMEDPREGVNPSLEGSHPGPSIAPQGPSSTGAGSTSPTLPEVKLKLAVFLSSFGTRSPRSNFLGRVHTDLGLGHASPAKLQKISQVIDLMSQDPESDLNSAQDGAAQLLQTIEEWEGTR